MTTSHFTEHQNSFVNDYFAELNWLECFSTCKIPSKFQKILSILNFDSCTVPFVVKCQAIIYFVSNFSNRYAVKGSKTFLSKFATAALKLFFGTNTINFVRTIVTIRSSITYPRTINAMCFLSRKCWVTDVFVAFTIEILGLCACIIKARS